MNSPQDGADAAHFIALSRVVLAQAFDDHALKSYDYCLRRCSDQHLAEDLLSVVFLQAWRSREGAFLRDDSLAPWLYGIAANVLRNEWRARRRYRSALERFHAVQRDVETPDHADRAVASADRHQARTALDQAFAQLSGKDRDVAELCLARGLSTGAAAVALNLAEGTVKSRLAHARSSLRTLLQVGDIDLETELAASHGPCRGERVPRARADGAATS